MSYCVCNFFSKALRNYVDVTVYIPSMHNGTALTASYEEIYPKDQKYKAVYLLHGALDDHSSWIRRTRVEEYAEKHQIALVMPSGQNGFYIHHAVGLDYFTFINYELPLWAESLFPLKTGREDRFVAGLSMGGYGAMRHGLASPERYGAIGSFSGVMDIAGFAAAFADSPESFFDFHAVFGREVEGTENDLYYLARQVAQKSLPKPKILMGCGTEDALCLEMVQKYGAYLKDLDFDVTYLELAGDHEWKVWDALVEKFLDLVHQSFPND